MLNYFGCMVNSGMAYFSGLSILFKISKLSWVHFVHASFCWLLAFIYGARASSFNEAGHRLEKSLLAARISIEDLAIRDYSALSKEERISLNYVQQDHYMKHSPLRPESYFNLNRISLMSTAATAATYAIFLLQFKQAGL